MKNISTSEKPTSVLKQKENLWWDYLFFSFDFTQKIGLIMEEAFQP